MTPQRILAINAASTAACAAAMLGTRGMLYPLFGLDAPLPLDVVAVGFLGYAAALAVAARQAHVSRRTLVAFTVADAAWVAGSALVLVVFWTELAALARVMVIAVALVVEVFASLQFRAVGALTRPSTQTA
jgi:hypothetical protein